MVAGFYYDVVVTAFAQGFLYQGLSGSFEHTRHLWVLAGLLMAAIEIRNYSGATRKDPDPNVGQ